MTTYFVQATAGNLFEDLHVKAPINANRAEIIAIARTLTTIKSRFVNFVL